MLQVLSILHVSSHRTVDCFDFSLISLQLVIASLEQFDVYFIDPKWIFDSYLDYVYICSIQRSGHSLSCCGLQQSTAINAMHRSVKQRRSTGGRSSSTNPNSKRRSTRTSVKMSASYSDSSFGFSTSSQAHCADSETGELINSKFTAVKKAVDASCRDKGLGRTGTRSVIHSFDIK